MRNTIKRAVNKSALQSQVAGQALEWWTAFGQACEKHSVEDLAKLKSK